MKPRQISLLFLVTSVIMVGCMDTGGPSRRAAPLEPAVGITQLSITDFTSRQGTTSVFFSPDPDLIAWSGRPPDYPLLGWIDWAGVADAYLVSIGQPSLGTTIKGSFRRTDLGDGTVEYSVHLTAKNALAWCVSLAPDFTLTDLFGAHAFEVAAGATPALGSCEFSAVWRQDAGTPIADLTASTNVDPGTYAPPGFEVEFISIRGTASGPLHEASGLGAEGTPGMLVIAQTNTNLNAIGHGVGNADAFPAEVVDLHVVGSNGDTHSGNTIN